MAQPQASPDQVAKATQNRLRQQLRQNQLAVREASRQLAEAAARQRYGGLSKPQAELVLATYILSDYDAAAAACLPEHCLQLRGVLLTQAAIHNLFRAVELDHLLAFHDVDNAAWARARKRARQYLNEAATWRWLRDQNISHAVAPSAVTVYKHCMGTVPASTRSMHRWTAKWRRRWSVHRGALSPQISVDVAALQAKAGLRGVHACAPKVVPENSPKIRAYM